MRPTRSLRASRTTPRGSARRLTGPPNVATAAPRACAAAAGADAGQAAGRLGYPRYQVEEPAPSGSSLGLGHSDPTAFINPLLRPRSTTTVTISSMARPRSPLEGVVLRAERTEQDRTVKPDRRCAIIDPLALKPTSQKGPRGQPRFSSRVVQRVFRPGLHVIWLPGTPSVTSAIAAGLSSGRL
jgi:hypothetical protein